tara:strand:+ start:790 stop:1560 length:771 start_codon:yes stop_codon:yes gene_type:complete
MIKANLIEVFSGIQGEGLLIGNRMIFARVDSCNLSCNYCDTPMGRPAHPSARIEKSSGKRNFELKTNPISTSDLIKAIDRLQKDCQFHQWISLTGGEPLLYRGFWEEIIPPLKKMGLKILLETNGTIPTISTRSYERTLEMFMRDMDMVSMDIKEHEDGAKVEEWTEMLRITGGSKNRYVKMVVRPNPNIEHFVYATKILHQADPTITLILMPVTPYRDIEKSPSPREMLDLQFLLMKKHPHILVIPQTHKLIGQM